MKFKAKYQSLLFVIVAIIIPPAISTISPSSKTKKGKLKQADTPKIGPQRDNVFDRNLIEAEPAGQHILLEHAAYYKNTSNRLFNGTVLGYVTPVITTTTKLHLACL